MMPDTVIGVVAHNNEEELDGLLRSLHAFTCHDNVHYVFMDNGSEDGTMDAYRGFAGTHPETTIIRTAENTGCNNGWNQIFKVSAMSLFKWLILLNSDIQVLRTGWNLELIEAFEADVAVVEALGVLHHPGGGLQHVGSAATAYRFGAIYALWAETAELHCQDGPWDVEYLPGWWGDIDLFNKLHDRGWHPGMAKQGVHVLHLCGKTERRLRDGDEFEAYKQEQTAKFVERWGPEGGEWWKTRYDAGAIEILAQRNEEDRIQELYPWVGSTPMCVIRK
jgi:GT2 family glycosyltransferase